MGARHGSKLHPQSLARGGRNGAAKYPERYRGELNGNSRLTLAEVQSIREMATSGLKHTAIAKLFSVTSSHVHKIVHRHNWRHV